MTHPPILNRPLPPSAPRPDAPPKPTPEQAAVIERTRRTKAAEAVHRAIARTVR